MLKKIDLIIFPTKRKSVHAVYSNHHIEVCVKIFLICRFIKVRKIIPQRNNNRNIFRICNVLHRFREVLQEHLRSGSSQ
jgi:hypothetical protein